MPRTAFAPFGSGLANQRQQHRDEDDVRIVWVGETSLIPVFEELLATHLKPPTRLLIKLFPCLVFAEGRDTVLACISRLGTSANRRHRRSSSFLQSCHAVLFT